MSGYAEAMKEYAEEEFCIHVRKIDGRLYIVRVENGISCGVGKSVIDAVQDAIDELDINSKRREKERLALVEFLDQQKKADEVIA